MAAAALNLTAYAYLFADPQPADVSAPRLGGELFLASDP